MKHFLTFLVLSSSSLIFAGTGLNSVLIIEENNLASDLNRQLTSPTISVVKEASESLSIDDLTFETSESNSDFKILLGDDETPTAARVSLKAVKKNVEAHEIDKQAILKEQIVTNQLTAQRMKNGTVKFFANKSVLSSDLNKLTCKGCEEFASAYVIEYTVKSPRDSGSGMASGRRGLIISDGGREAGSGMASGKAKIVTDRDTGRSKGRFISVTDDRLVSSWIELFKSEPEQELVVEYEKFNSNLISDYQNAKSLKLIVPVAMDKEVRMMSMEFAIKEQGVKLAIEGESAIVTLQVSEAKPMSPREK